MSALADKVNKIMRKNYGTPILIVNNLSARLALILLDHNLFIQCTHSLITLTKAHSCIHKLSLQYVELTAQHSLDCVTAGIVTVLCGM